MSRLGKTISKYLDLVQIEQEPAIKEIAYKIYWLENKPHCDQAKPVTQVDNRTGWRCKHYE
jgi:hypothetical protein